MPALIQSIKLTLVSLSDNDLLKYSFTLIDGISLRSEYQGIVPTVVDAKVLFASYGTAVANFAKGGEAVRMQRDALRVQVEHTIRQWSQYATDETPNQPVLWATAHFNLTKTERTPRPMLSVPGKFSTTDGPVKGSVDLRQNPQATTKAYVFEYALMTDGSAELHWQYCLSNISSCMLTGLLSGRQYQFRAGAWNGTGTLAYSQVETRYIQ